MRKKNKEEVIEIKSFSNEVLEESTVLFSSSKEHLSEKLLEEKYLKLKKNAQQLDYEMNFVGVYSYAYNKNADFENLFNDIAMGLTIATKDLIEVDEQYDFVMNKTGYANSIENNIKLNDHLNLALSFQRNVLSSFKEIRDLYINKINMTAMAIGLKKNNIELANLSKRLNKILCENGGSLKKANEYIYYHSGDKIVNIVEKIVFATKQLKDYAQLDIHHIGYYINSDCIITLDVKEWTDLYNKLKFVFKMLNGIDQNIYNEIKELLEDFEANYMIIILYEEMERLK